MKVLDFKDKRYWSLMLNIGLPIAVQNLIFNSLTLVDNVLIGGLGEDYIAAVSVANKLSFIFMLIMFGINSGANMFSAQFWGKKDLKGVRKVLGISLVLGVSVGLPFMLLGTVFASQIVRIFSDDPEVIQKAASYLKIIAFSYPINAITASYGMQSRGVGRTKLPLLSSAAALVFNTILTYLLIYGKLGLPEMGIEGAALATVLARFVECFILLVLIYRNNYELAAKFSELKGYTKDFLMRFMKSVSPVIINELLWAVGVTGYAYFYGKLGTESFAAVQILDVINGMLFSLFIGMGNACGSIIGNLIGGGEEETAKVYAKRSVAYGAGFGFIIGIVMLFTAPVFFSFFNVGAETLSILRSTVIVYAAFTIPKVTNMMMIVGVCRGGGDTVFAMAIDVLAPWIIGLPMAFLGVYVFSFPVFLVMAMINMEEIAKNFFGVRRLLSEKWLHNLVRDIRHEEEIVI